MPKKQYAAEDIIHQLREADVLPGQGNTVMQAYDAFIELKTIIERKPS